MPNTEQSIQETGGIPEIEMTLEVSGMTVTPVDRSLSIRDMAADAKATGDAILNVRDALNDEIGNVAADVATLIETVGGIEQWTGEDLPVSTVDETKISEKFGAVDEALEALDGKTGSDIAVSDEDSTTIAEALGGLKEDVDAIKEWTGEDIKVAADDPTTIAQALRNTFAATYPVGSIFITTAPTLPTVIASIGTWHEVAMPLTHGDLKNGTRSIVEVESGFVAGNVHFWLRTA